MRETSTLTYPRLVYRQFGSGDTWATGPISEEGSGSGSR